MGIDLQQVISSSFSLRLVSSLAQRLPSRLGHPIASGLADLIALRRDSSLVRALRANLELLGATESAVVHRADVLPYIAALPALAFDVAFADPPYRLGLAHAVAARWTQAPFARLLGIEHESGAEMPAGGVTRRYGITSITLYRHVD